MPKKGLIAQYTLTTFFTARYLRVERVIFVSGKLYYDLIKERQTRGVQDSVALVRVEV